MFARGTIPALAAMLAAAPALAAPVAPSRLVPLLPPTPEGWVATDPVESESEGEVKISVAGRTYAETPKSVAEGEAAADPATVSINITDCADSEDIAAAYAAAWSEPDAEHEDGFAKAITFEGSPGRETFDKPAETAVIVLRVRDRFFVQIETVGLPPEQARAWLARVDLKKLAALK